MVRALRAVVLAAATLAASSVVGLAGAAPDFVPAFGPAFGQNSYTARIHSVDGVPDVDDYVNTLRPGDVLTVAVSAARRSRLLPLIELLDPDGADAEPAIRTTKLGTAAAFKAFAVTKTGRWTVRVSGSGGTEGEYTIAFAVKAAPPIVLHHQHLGDDKPLFKVQTFPGLDGDLLDMKLTWSARELPVTLKAFNDPLAADVLFPDGRKAIDAVATDLKHRTLTFTALPLHGGDGNYSLRLRTPQGSATYDLTIALTPQGRPRSRRPVVLGAVEPALDAADPPLRGRPGFTLRLHGRNFSISPMPRVFFGLAQGSVAATAPDGTYLDVVVPEGVPGITVPVAVVNADGQAAVRGRYFFFIQPIRVIDLVDDDGTPVRAGSTRGGRALHLLGAFFEAGQAVSFGGSPAPDAAVLSPTEIRVITPPAPAGLIHVRVTDSFGGVADSAFEFRYKTPPTFGLKPYAPSVAAVQSPVLVTIQGSGFEASDQLRFAGAPLASSFVSATRRTFALPALAAGGYSVALTDSIGTVEAGPDFAVKPPPVISSVTITAGPHVGATGIPLTGGTTIRVDGSDFHETDTVTLGATAVTFDSHTKTRFTFDAPPGSLGSAALTIIDGANQSATRSNALRYVGYTDATSARSPGATTADNLLANRGAIGDLDGDGRKDDLVLVTSYYYLGTRAELTRVFIGDSAGKLVDRTAANFPAAGSDSSANDNWNASALAIGDVDGTHGADIMIAGGAPFGPNGGVYKSVRLFKNDGSGKFTQDEASAPPSSYRPGVVAQDQAGTYFTVYGAVFESGSPTAMALGDLDNDGDPDLVVCRDHYDVRYVGIDPTKVNFTTSPPSVTTANAVYLSYFQYQPGTKVYEDDIAHGHGFVDKTASSMPSAGDSTRTPRACFQAKDLALGDVDGDGDLDLVETWDDPTTVSAYGTYKGSGVDVPRIATRVLLNDGHGVFTDATATWMPSAASPEFWQANRLALADLDKDGDLDLVLLHVQGTDAFNTKPPSFSTTALRVLRNDGRTGHFVDVTATAIPALPGNGDNFRGQALAVRDVDGDGWPDIVIGTNEVLSDVAGNPLRSTRLLRGGPGLVFTLDSAFLPTTLVDTGEAGDLLLGDLSGTTDPSLILLTTVVPAVSHGGESLRVLDWNR